jgi:hypothetical protein
MALLSVGFASVSGDRDAIKLLLKAAGSARAGQMASAPGLHAVWPLLATAPQSPPLGLAPVFSSVTRKKKQKPLNCQILFSVGVCCEPVRCSTNCPVLINRLLTRSEKQRFIKGHHRTPLRVLHETDHRPRCSPLATPDIPATASPAPVHLQTARAAGARARRDGSRGEAIPRS